MNLVRQRRVRASHKLLIALVEPKPAPAKKTKSKAVPRAKMAALSVNDEPEPTPVAVKHAKDEEGESEVDSEADEEEISTSKAASKKCVLTLQPSQCVAYIDFSAEWAVSKIDVVDKFKWENSEECVACPGSSSNNLLTPSAQCSICSPRARLLSD